MNPRFAPGFGISSNTSCNSTGCVTVVAFLFRERVKKENHYGDEDFLNLKYVIYIYIYNCPTNSDRVRRFRSWRPISCMYAIWRGSLLAAFSRLLPLKKIHHFQEISGEPIILRQVKDYLVIEKWKNPSCLGYIGDYTTQLCGDCSKPLQGSLLNNQYNGSPETFTFFGCLIFPAAVVTSATSSWVVLSRFKGWYGSLWRSRVTNHSNATGSIHYIT